MSTMKRMWTDREIRSMAVHSVENKEDLKVFEHIVDKDGHKRFIEANGTPTTIEKVASGYCKWSLSGSHLMCVYTGNIESGAEIANLTALVQFDLPKWIRDKIVPALSNLVAYKNIVVVNTSTYVENSYQGYFDKNSDGIAFYLSASKTFDYNGTFRIQFDLIIDNA